MNETRIKAVLFDRDGTLCCPGQSLEGEFYAWVQAHSRYDPVPFVEAQAVVWDEFFASHRSDLITDLGVEARFWLDFWRRSLYLLGIDAEKIQEAVDRFIFYRFLEPYPEVGRVLNVLGERGYALGVISNTLPSLRDSLVHLGVAHLFQVAIDSASVGAFKPAPAIYELALQALNVSAPESLFVDNEYENVIGARRLGMDALLLDRASAGHCLEKRIIADLEGILAYLEISCPAGSTPA